MLNLGKVKPGSTIFIPFDTFDGGTGASITMTGLAVTDVEIYKDGGVTQRASDAGYTLLDTDGIDFDGITGIHGLSINLADNTTAGFWAAGSKYFVVISSITVDAQTVNFVAACFEIAVDGAVLDTTIATLSTQTSFTLTAGPAEDDALNGCVCYIHDVASAVQGGFAVVADYVGSTRTVTLTAGVTFTAAATDNISFFPPANTRWLGATAQTGNDLGAKVVGTLASGTHNPQSGDAYARLGAPAGASVSADVAAVKSDTAAILVDTAAMDPKIIGTIAAGTHNPQSGDAYARLGAPAGASVSADVAAVKAETAAIVADTNELQTDWVNGGRLDLILDARASQASVDTVDSNVDAILADTADMQPKLGTISNLGAGATIGANLADMAGATFATSTDSLEAIRDRGDAAWTTGAGGSDRLLMVDTTIATLSSQTSFTLTAGSADNNAYVNCTIVVEDATTATQKAVGLISAYTGSTKTVTLKYDPAIFTMAAGDKVYILAENSLKSTAQNRQLDVSAGGEAGLDWANVGSPTTSVNLSATTVNLVNTLTTYTGNTPQTGDAFARLGAPAGASVSADVAAVKAETAAIVADTNELQTDWANGGRLDLILDARASQASVDVIDTNVDAILVDTGTSGVIVATNNDKTGYALSAAGVDAIWDEPLAAHTTADTPGRVLNMLTQDSVTLSTDVALGSIIGQLLDGGTSWSYDRTLHSMEVIADTLSSAAALVSGTADSGTTTTMVDAARTETDTDYWKDCVILFKTGNIAGQARLITGFTPGTDTITFAPATTQAVGTNDYDILPAARVDVGLWAGSAPNALQSGRVDSYTGAMGADVVTAAAVADNAIDAGAIAADALTAAKIAADAFTAAKFAADVSAEIADAVWDEARSGHTNAGSFGQGVASVQGNVTGSVASVTGAVGSVTGNVGGNLVGTIGGLTAAALADFFDTNSGTTYASAAAGSVVKEIADNAGGSALTEAGIADAVWNEALAGHLGAGSAGEALDAAGSAGDPWITALPGAYGAGTAGNIIGNLLDAAISSRASQTSLDTVDGIVDAIVLDTNELQQDWVNGGRLDNILDARASQASVDTVDGIVDAILDDTGTSGVVVADKTGYALSAAGVDAIWDESLAAHTTADTPGKVLNMLTQDSVTLSTDVALGSIIGQLLDDGTAWSYDRTTDSLEALGAGGGGLDAAGVRAAIGMASANLDTQLAAITADTNELQTDWANGGRLDLILDARASQASVDTVDGIVDQILADTGTDGVVVNAASLAADAVTEIANGILDLANGIETGLTLRQAQRLIAAAAAGKVSGAETTTVVIRNAVADSKARITATVDANGNRSAITADVS